MKKTLKFLVVVVAAILLCPACDPVAQEEEATAPAIPPYETLAIDFSTFTNSHKSATDMNVDDSTTNFKTAAEQVGFWNFILFINLVVPVTSFYHSFSQQPEYLGDMKWQWSYSVPGLTSEVTARLTGEIRTNDVLWNMYVSKEGAGAYNEFLWLEGISKIDGLSGQWTLNVNAEQQVPYLQINWMRTGDTVGSITYNYIRELDKNGNDDKFHGSYLTHGLQDDYYNAYYDIHYWNILKQSFVDVDIEWSLTEFDGHVKAPFKFSDEDWHCWDSVGINSTCK